MSDSQSKPAESSPPKRSSFERMLVWGAIVLLIGIVGLEARARFGFQPTLDELQSRFHAVEDEEEGAKVTLADIKSFASGGPSYSDPTPSFFGGYIVTMRWFSLFKEYRIDLRFETEADDAPLLDYQTSDFAEPAPADDVPVDDVPPDTPAGEMPEGEAPDGETPDGETPDGETPDAAAAPANESPAP